MAFLEKLESLCSAQPLSDVILQAGFRVGYSTDGGIRQADFAFEQADVPAFLEATGQKDFRNDVPFGFTVGPHRFRAISGRTRGVYRTVMRLLPAVIPPPADLRIPPRFLEVSQQAQSGLILVVGPAGSGKTTAIASVIQARAQNSNDHILTVEDPIEYELRGRTPLQVYQREVGENSDVATFGAGLKSGLRQAPKVIYEGEARDAEGAFKAIQAAMTGHLVFTTLHSDRASLAIQSLLKMIPAADQSRVVTELPSFLRCVLCLRLIPSLLHGRVAIHELMMPIPSLKNIISQPDFKPHQIDAEIAVNSHVGCLTFEQSLRALRRPSEQLISEEVFKEQMRIFKPTEL